MPYLLALIAVISGIAGFSLWVARAGGAFLSYVARNPSRGVRVASVLWVAVAAEILLFMVSLQWSWIGWPIILLAAYALLLGVVGPATCALEKQFRARRRSSRVARPR
ncbi:MAG TPA: hypothetical protein VF665_21835 [Longimicrobium sp.]|uniref:hypothetical protein n=1 Tax=Longimicrobium sp. TaxID=2029185 RepID=UPI002EDB976C